MLRTRSRSWRRCSVAALVLTAALPAVAAAQSWDVTAQVGVGIPAGDLSDTHDPGLGMSLSATRWFGPRLGLRFGGAANMLGGSSGNIPDASFWHYNIGPEFDLVDPHEHKVAVHANAGIGATTTQFDGGTSATDFTVNLGMDVEFPLNDYFRLIVGPSLYVIFADETQTIVPVTAGFRYFFSK